jgi:uroporphyrin-III C-methyltransferase
VTRRTTNEKTVPARKTRPTGSVAFVGAGPGDPGLITVLGLELVRGCDALVYDRLVAPELVDVAREDALRIPRDGLGQEEVNRLLVDLGGAGFEVVRLKGGDPFVFGRGGEEALALAEAGVPFDVVPGVSSLAAVPAAAAIPLTHRGVAAEVRVLTGRSAGVEPLAPTVVVFMGLETISEVRDRLLGEGLALGTPAAVISRGTTPDQEVVVADLGGIAEAAEGLAAPALVIVGEVVALRKRLVEGRFTSHGALATVEG